MYFFRSHIPMHGRNKVKAERSMPDSLLTSTRIGGFDHCYFVDLLERARIA